MAFLLVVHDQGVIQEDPMFVFRPGIIMEGQEQTCLPDFHAGLRINIISRL
jgi:hypothetical protein